MDTEVVWIKTFQKDVWGRQASRRGVLVKLDDGPWSIYVSSVWVIIIVKAIVYRVTATSPQALTRVHTVSQEL